MAIDGPGIIESDLGHDVYNEILDLYDAGASISEIQARLRQFEDALDDELDREIFLAASARAFWEIGCPDSAIIQDLSDTNERGVSHALWLEAAGAEIANSRASIISRLLRQVKVARKTPRARKKYAKVRFRMFSVGDCLELPVASNVYRGVVCAVTEYRGNCDYGILVMAPETNSTTESFVAGSYFGRRIGTSTGEIAGPHVIRPEHRMLVREGNPFSLVGHVELDPGTFMIGSYGGVLSIGDVIADFERTREMAAVFGNQLLPLAELLSTSDSSLN